MKAFLGRLTVNSAAALTVGGTVLAIGIALGALGLDEIEAPDSPWANLWVIVGSVVALVSLVWIAAILGIGLWQTLKADRFLDQLGKAIAQGKDLTYRRGETWDSDVASWAEKCRALLGSGLGSGEARAFIWKYQEDKHRVDASSVIYDALPRLVEIHDRPNLRVRLEFDHHRDWMK